MKITPINPPPLSEQIFNVELTGLELGIIKILTGRIGGWPEVIHDQDNIRLVSDKMYSEIGKLIELTIPQDREVFKPNAIMISENSLSNLKNALDNPIK
jgi:hypothetical protein